MLVATLLVLSVLGANPKGPLGSVGHYSKGSLDGGLALPEDGDHHYTLFPARCYGGAPGNTFGHPSVVQAVVDAAAAVHVRYPDAPKVVVAEIANAHGGPTPYHLSHQNGLDADVLFLQRGAVAPCTPYGQLPRFEAPDASGTWRVTTDFEPGWNWALAEVFATRADVQAIFVGGLVKPALEAWAKANDVPAATRRLTLAKLVAVKCTAPKGVVIDSYKGNYCPHDDHFHVRFKCPKDSPRCRSQR